MWKVLKFLETDLRSDYKIGKGGCKGHPYFFIAENFVKNLYK